MSQAGLAGIAEGGLVVETLTGNSGGAVPPTANNIDTVGSGSITIIGNPATSTLTTQLTGLTNHNVLVGAGTDTITNIAPSATSGVPLISQGASADPIFGTAVVAGGGTGATSLASGKLVLGQGTSPVSSIAYSSSPAANDIAQFDGSGNLNANEFIAGTTLTINSNSIVQSGTGSFSAESIILQPHASSTDAGVVVGSLASSLISAGIPTGLASASLVVVGEAGSVGAGGVITQINYSGTNVGQGCGFIIGRTRSTTPGTYTSVVNGDSLYYVNIDGDDGTQFRRAGQITCTVGGTVSSGIVPGQLNFYTTNTSGTSTLALSIYSSQQVTCTSTVQGTSVFGKYTATATAASTTTLTVTSTQIQDFTGSTTQTVTLPVTSTLTTGQSFTILNHSSGNVTVQSSGANTLSTLTNLQGLTCWCISTSGTDTSSWSWTVITLAG